MASFTKAKDRRGRGIRGLWERNGKFYAQMRTPEKLSAAWFPLLDSNGQHVTTVTEAIEARNELLKKRRENDLPRAGRAPLFSKWVDEYVQHHRDLKKKRESTIDKEEASLKLWRASLGNLRLHQILRRHVNLFMSKRRNGGAAPRTVNLDVIALNNCLNHAIDEGFITRLPTENLRPLPAKPPKRRLYSHKEIESVALAGFVDTRNGVLFNDYLELLCYTGARRSEALRLKWCDVDWQNKQLTIGADALSKNHEARVIDFNPPLEKLLKAMRKRVKGDFLFPSPLASDKDRSTKTHKETLTVARTNAKLPDFTFHDCRHYFISWCVMAGIDYMTIARWVGHKDGGVLIGKVYGHLSSEHAQKQAAKLSL